MVIGLLGILKAGGAYVPLDPNYPTQRITDILEDGGVELLLTKQHLKVQLQLEEQSRPLQLIVLDSSWSDIAEQSTAKCHSQVNAANLAYVIYTSGSTGKPKGVVVTHQALVSYTLEIAEQFELQASDRILQFASVGFDVVVEELFPTWISEATVVLLEPKQLLSCKEFQQLITQQQLTVFELPTAYWHQWVLEIASNQEQVADCVRLVLVGGERISPERLKQWQQLSTPLVHVYGLTETTVTSTLYHLPTNAEPRKTETELPIGRPIANTQIYILDTHLQPVPIGVTGEIYIGGAGIARGYLNRPELTAERFIPNSFSKEAGTRLYKTGDKARYLENGEIEYIGRIDYQVKLRGFRIELGEIEAALNQHSAISNSVVIVREDVAGQKRLVAYLVFKQNRTVTNTELRRFLQEKLPLYSIPTSFVNIEATPLSPNGKVDRRSLPIPDNLRPELEVDYVMPETEAEQTIADVWKKVLDLEKIGIHDNFFEIGGHSLLLMQVNSRLRQLFDANLSIVDMFRYPTISSLSEYLNNINPSQPPSVNEDLQNEKLKAGKAKQKRRREKIRSI
jgi:amino acid adenylation domain-containing protein